MKSGVLAESHILSVRSNASYRRLIASCVSFGCMRKIGGASPVAHCLQEVGQKGEKTRLHFSKSDNLAIEELYSTHYVVWAEVDAMNRNLE